MVGRRSAVRVCREGVVPELIEPPHRVARNDGDEEEADDRDDNGHPDDSRRRGHASPELGEPGPDERRHDTSDPDRDSGVMSLTYAEWSLDLPVHEGVLVHE